MTTQVHTAADFTSPAGVRRETLLTPTHRLDVISTYQGALRTHQAIQGGQELLRVTLRPLTPDEDNRARAAVVTVALGTQGLIEPGNAELRRARALLEQLAAPTVAPELAPWPVPAQLAEAGPMRVLRLTHHDPDVLRALFPSASDLRLDRGDVTVMQPLQTLLPDVPLPWVKRQDTAVFQGGLAHPFEATLRLRAGQQTWGVPMTALTLTTVLAATTAHAAAQLRVHAYPTTHGEGYVPLATPALGPTEQASLHVGAHGACLHVAGQTGPTTLLAQLRLP